MSPVSLETRGPSQVEGSSDFPVTSSTRTVLSVGKGGRAAVCTWGQLLTLEVAWLLCSSELWGTCPQPVRAADLKGGDC
jgi:hypothetical protein